MKSKMPSPRKKPYRGPRLAVYGELRSLTMAKGGGAQDGAGKPKTKAAGPPA